MLQPARLFDACPEISEVVPRGGRIHEAVHLVPGVSHRVYVFNVAEVQVAVTILREKKVAHEENRYL